MPTASELIAHNRTVKEIEQLIGADWLIYQDLEDLIECAKDGNPSIVEFDCSVFNGKYITGDITPEYLLKLEQARKESSKIKANVDFEDDNAVIDLHNND